MQRALALLLELLEREQALSACLWEASLKKPWGPVITAKLEAQGKLAVSKALGWDHWTTDSG